MEAVGGAVVERPETRAVYVSKEARLLEEASWEEAYLPLTWLIGGSALKRSGSSIGLAQAALMAYV